MKKNLFLSLIGLALLVGACSKSDDNKDENEDLVFNAPYYPIKDIQDLKSKTTWYYEGAKIGSKKYGAISKSNCISKNMLTFVKTSNGESDSMIYDSYDGAGILEKGCKLDFRRAMKSVKLTSEGKIFVEIYDFVYDSSNNEQIKEEIYKGNLEVGFQKDMLRIEDKFTHYNGNEKVYLYFKSASIK
ncbi:hypothetical protein [Flavobacterium sp. NKUCC04_CG]|uniref:hypothetical protein n=1 Tax=Flavobacterium sp. NKUCC04_CG TaxID=2842121 RepID=UPI001C5B6562|nr:hypothetical protein [Flavobacterium sp. NKUCC04_CG]MBW3518662.1 hypothetical protein [Flavobacterium sp. NKUCC04_CG]